MKRINQLGLGVIISLVLWVGLRSDVVVALWQMALSPQALAPTPVFRRPVVEEAPISGYFDHDDRPQVITFYDGRSSAGGQGFLFTCPDLENVAPGVGSAWIGCAEAADTEAACPNEQELWYDNHRGTDYEYVAGWHTGDTCDLDRFEPVNPPIYAPAAGLVNTVGENHPFNGNFILLYHDLNGDGNYYNDGLRSYYLHFADNGLMVDEGEILEAGDLLGYGGATGLSWTPHLHFEVQRQTEQGWQPVDPFGWTGSGADPWLVPNHPLWLDSPVQAEAAD